MATTAIFLGVTAEFIRGFGTRIFAPAGIRRPKARGGRCLPKVLERIALCYTVSAIEVAERARLSGSLSRAASSARN